ncbi:STAS domain-containing protein [Streptomyces longispororuber]|uniref:STAS domain-containing protein n=1 Tax=Streptomyces longispororuber TaxID=68230 RepID=UPI0036F924AC
MEDRFWLSREDDDAGARAVLRLSGELDLEGAPSLAEAAGPLLHDRARTVVLDCEDVTFCDSSGLNTLLILREHSETSGARLLISRPSPSIRHLLRLTHTEQVFSVVDGIDGVEGTDDVNGGSTPHP